MLIRARYNPTAGFPAAYSNDSDSISKDMISINRYVREVALLSRSGRNVRFIFCGHVRKQEFLRASGSSGVSRDLLMLRPPPTRQFKRSVSPPMQRKITGEEGFEAREQLNPSVNLLFGDSCTSENATASPLEWLVV